MPRDDNTTHFGFETVLSREKAARVAGVFHSVAGRYDVMNDLMSLGTHRVIKRIAVEMTRARPGQTILDIAGGTGDLVKLMSPIVGNEGHVILSDINASMLAEGRDRLIDDGITSNVTYLQADAEKIPLPDESVDVVTIAFGLRNVTDKDRALSAMFRVLKPRGRLIIVEFSHPPNTVLNKAYKSFSGLWPGIGKLVTGDEDSYRYLVESIAMHPGQEELADMIRAAGFKSVRIHNMMGGVVAIHEARR